MKNILIRVSALNLQHTALAACLALTLPSIGNAQTCTVYCPDGSRPRVDCNASGDPCSSSGSRGGSYTAPARDYEAERRQQEAAVAEAAAETERQRLAEERRVNEKAEKQAAFIRERDLAACKLKGAVCPGGVPQNGGLKGSGNYGLKEASSDSGLKGSTPPGSAPPKQVLAWKQLHCAASITKYALSALQTNGDTVEFGMLQSEALKALDGQRTSVECGSAPPFPDARGKAVDVDRLEAKEKTILERAGKIADRMKQSDARKPGALSSTPAPANETEMDKLRRVQKELNQKNSGPIKNQQDENNRRELTRLILENEKLTSVGVSLAEDTPRPPRAHPRSPPPPAPAKP